MLQPPEGINQMSIDSAGNFICGGGSWRTIPVWTDNPQDCASQPCGGAATAATGGG